MIVPFYDETAYLTMALGSIRNQGLRDVEVILVNDNPDRFGPAYFAGLPLPPEVRVLHHAANGGLSRARNSGLAEARGARIAFLDADDYYLADGLAAQLALSESSGADITHAACCISPVGSPDLTLLGRDKALFSVPRQGDGLRGVEEAQFFTSSWSSLYRRDFLDAGGLRFDPEQVKFEDRLFVLQTVIAARRIACLGAPARVWRRRAGSISTQRADPEVLRLQLQLLEKCVGVMRAHAARPRTPPRFLRRELFNTLSRLIWDVDLLPQLAAGGDATMADYGPRIRAMLGEDRFGQQIFSDPVLSRISRVGQQTRKGRISRVDFFEIHRALRAGDVAAAAACIAARAPTAAPRRARRRNGKRLILHLGMHKTGSTWLQRCLQAEATGLRGIRVLFPAAGLAGPAFVPVRPGGFPGHLGLMQAVHDDDDAPWRTLAAEIAASRCDTVILSCENFLAPLARGRDDLLARLFDRLATFESCQPIAFVRRPDRGPEALYREVACNGQRLGARSVQEFMVDYGALLTDLPALFAPFEAFAGRPVALGDYDAAAAQGRLWSAFTALAGLGELSLAASATPAYRTPTSAEVQAARLANALVASEPQRRRVLRGFFAAGGEAGGPDAPLLSPQDRLALVDGFAERSAAFAQARGYAPALADLRAALATEAWHPPPGPDDAMLERLQQARLQAEFEPRAPAPADSPAPAGPPEMIIRIRPRPWLTRAIGRLRGLRR